MEGGLEVMEIINVNQSNIDHEHICCAIADKKGECCVDSKKTWMKDRFNDGLVFKKLNVRGKVFIEYVPAENAWCPIEADNYMFINCFWVSGQYAGQGHANNLLEQCISDAKADGKAGLVILSSEMKKPFLADPKYLKHRGFQVCDKAQPYYELLALPFNESIQEPRFKDCCKQGRIAQMGVVLYYSNQCPHTQKYAPLLEKIAKDRGVAFALIRYETKEQAQNAPAPFTTYSLFYDGQFVTNEILSEKKFIKFLDDNGL